MHRDAERHFEMSLVRASGRSPAQPAVAAAASLLTLAFAASGAFASDAATAKASPVQTCAPAPSGGDTSDGHSPPDTAGPTLVEFSMRIVDLTDIDVVEGRFGFTGYGSFSWCDPRQAFDPVEAGADQKIFAGPRSDQAFARIWQPDLGIANGIGPVRITKRVITLRADGRVRIDGLFDSEVAADFDLRAFPLDQQVLAIHVESFSWNEDVLRLREGSRGVDVSDGVSIPEWRVLAARARIEESRGPKGDVAFSRLLVEVDVAREYGFYVLKVGVPLVLIVVLSWSVFWMKDEPMAGRIRVSSTGVLTIVAFQFAVGGNLPRVPYLTLLDRVMIVSFMLISITVLQSILVAHYEERDPARARRIDRISRWVFPLLYAALLAVVVELPHVF
jgi:hypothetical protein